MTKKDSLLWEISVTVEHLIKTASPELLNFTKSTARFSVEAEQKMYASFHRVRGLRYMTVSEILKTV